MLEQIHADLAPLKAAEIKRPALDQFVREYRNKNEGWLLVRVIIRSNHITIQNLNLPTINDIIGLRQMRLEWMRLAFHRLAQTVALPNADLILSLNDCDDTVFPVPIFGFAKNPQVGIKTILIPDFEALVGNEHFLQAVHSGNERYSWSQKRNQSVFRGNLTGGSFNHENFLEFPRSKAVSLSLQFPHLIDARFSYCPGWEIFKSRYEDYFASRLSVEEQVAYKYQLLIDGNSCAYSRAYWQMFSNCVILKQSSNNIQWFYRPLLPFVHYIPIKEDMSDLPERIDWALKNDAEAQKISLQAQDFARNNLTYARVMQYLYLLLVEYAALQN